MEAATSFRDLAALPGNRFEALVGDRKGQYSIRINDQWRICFACTNYLWQTPVTRLCASRRSFGNVRLLIALFGYTPYKSLA
jgi:proteic killer suppression protein